MKREDAIHEGVQQMRDAAGPGGPAFPVVAVFDKDGQALGVVPGMSVRDYMAGQALAGMMANPMYDNNSTRNLAQQAYMTADAMIKERDDA